MEADCSDMKSAIFKINSKFFSGKVETMTPTVFDWDYIKPSNAMYAVTNAACVAAHKSKKKNNKQNTK